jgi:phosphoribosylformylglycinamidine synthase subunit PurS
MQLELPQRYDARVEITLKEGVPDVIGRQILGNLRGFGFSGVKGVRSGKMIELQVTEKACDVEQKVQRMCQELLANRVVEDYKFRLTCHSPQPDGTICKMALAPWESAYPTEMGMQCIEPKTIVYSVGLENRWPAIGPYRVMRAEWYRDGATIFIIRYSKEGHLVNEGWRLDVGARLFRDTDIEGIGKRRAQSLQRLAPEIVAFVVRYDAAIGAHRTEVDG